jgi:hypothetical protein
MLSVTLQPDLFPSSTSSSVSLLCSTLSSLNVLLMVGNLTEVSGASETNQNLEQN